MYLESWKLAVIAGLLLGGCGSADDSFSDEMPEDLPQGQSGTDGATDTDPTVTSAGTSTSGAETTGEPGPACQSSEDCLGNNVCVAPWDPETQTAGEPDCAFACIPSYDETQWCADAEACCDPDAICTARGYCVPPQQPGEEESSSSGDGSGSTGSGATGEGSTGEESTGGGTTGTGGEG